MSGFERKPNEVALIEYVVRIMPPKSVHLMSAAIENDLMDKALATLINGNLGADTIENAVYNELLTSYGNLARDGFTVEVSVGV